MRTASELIEAIERNEVALGILGLGYVGLPLAVSFAKRGVRVIGFDKSTEKAGRVNSSKNYIADVDDADLSMCVERKMLAATTDFDRIAECDAIMICVPTPLDRFRKPDMSFIEAACRDIGRRMKPGTFISLESTTYPTTTEFLVRPLLEETSGLEEGRDFWLCFSPERVDPGNRNYRTENTPKIVGGLGEEALRIALALYGKAIRSLYPVESPRIAEMVKILENTYRLVNISLINELTLLGDKMEIDMWKVIAAANTKPYGYQAFYPGPGIGGHCIPLDPFYLEHIAKNYNFDLTMIHAAGLINNQMPHRMTVKISSALNQQGKPIKGSNILFIGVAYKPDVADDRESPAVRIIDEVARKGAVIGYHDPLLPRLSILDGRKLKSIPLTTGAISDADCVVVCTRHTGLDVDLIGKNADVIVDLVNAFPEHETNVYRL